MEKIIHTSGDDSVYSEKNQIKEQKPKKETAADAAPNEANMLAAILEFSEDAIFSRTFDGTITSWNKGAERIFGYGPEEAVGKSIAIIYPSGELSEDAKTLEKIRRGQSVNGYETVRKRKDGTRLPVSLSAAPIRNAEGRVVGIAEIIRDISDLEQARQIYLESEEQLRRSQKVEIIGRLAGGVAHDFNNFLAVIMLHVDMLALQLPADSPLRFRVEEIKLVTNKAAATVRQLLAFGRRQTMQPAPVVLNQVVREFVKILRSLIGEDIEVETALEPELGVCFVDPDQMTQVLMNLAVNARDAMPRGGVIKIETSNIFLDKSRLRLKTQPVGDYIQLTVTDNGTGMDEETKRRIFEPFFTTKEPNKGTGLGLATVYGIVKQSNGFIWVDSEPGEGTVFQVQFPRIDQAAKNLIREEKAAAMPTGNETILLVEDEEPLRRAAVEALNLLGYRVLEAGSGAEAFEIARKFRQPIHLLLTDVVMPRMNGRELAEKVRHLHPEAFVLFMSGYNDDIISNHGVLEENVHFLSKPFTPLALAEKVRGILEKNKFPAAGR